MKTNQEIEQEIQAIEDSYDSTTKDKIDAVVKEGEYLTKKQLNAMLPQLFMRDGRIRKAPFTSTPRGVEAIAAKLKMAEIVRRAVTEDKDDLILYMDAGTLVIMAEIRDVIVAADMFADMALKGWHFNTRRF